MHLNILPFRTAFRLLQIFTSKQIFEQNTRYALVSEIKGQKLTLYAHSTATEQCALTIY